MFGNARLVARAYSSGQVKSRHAQVYTSIIPAMIPVFLLGSAVYLGLEMAQLKLSHEKYMTEATRRIEALDAEIAALQEKTARAQQQNKIANVDQSSNTPPSRRWWWNKG